MKRNALKGKLPYLYWLIYYSFESKEKGSGRTGAVTAISTIIFLVFIIIYLLLGFVFNFRLFSVWNPLDIRLNWLLLAGGVLFFNYLVFDRYHSYAQGKLKALEKGMIKKPNLFSLYIFYALLFGCVWITVALAWFYRE